MARKVTIAGALVILILLVANPWWYRGYWPEGNPLCGPLWLLKVRDPFEKSIGALVSVLLLAAVVAPVFRLRWYVVVLCLLAVAAWMACGVYLASGAVR